MKSLLSILAVLFAGLAPSSTASAAEPLRLRVLTFNVWGIWAITPSREARLAAVGPAVAALEPDLVALQEVWLDEDARRLEEAFAAAGLPHTRRFYSTWPGDSGLMIASRYPIIRTDFIEYDEGTHPHVPWHVDWMAGKGLARVRVQTPKGPVDFANTHVQASYGGDREYDLVQLAQLLQAADFLDADRAVPLVVAGDLNVRCDSLQYRSFALRAGLTPTDPGCGIDSISHRRGEAAHLVTRDVRTVLTEAVDLTDGTRQPLSDHPSILAELDLVPARPALAAAPPSPQAWMALAREALPRLHERRRTLSHGQTQHALLCFVLLQLALLLYVLRTGRLRHPLPKRTPLLLMLSVALLAATWFGYLGLSYAPKHLGELEGVRARIEGPLQLGLGPRGGLPPATLHADRR